MTAIGVIVALIVAVVGVAAGYFIGYNNRKKTAEAQIGSAEAEATRLVNEAIKTADQKRKEAVLEATIMGPSIRFTAPAVIAMAGANMTPKLNGTAMPLYEAVEVHAGDTLVCGFAMTGCRGYLAVAGGFAVEPVLRNRICLFCKGLLTFFCEILTLRSWNHPQHWKFIR
jgi:allophanate hydrolase subunit 2